MLCEQRNATAGADRHLKVKQTGSRCQRFCLLPGNRVGISEVSRKLLPNLKEPNLNNFKFKSSLGVLIDNSLLTPCSPVPYPHRPVPNAALGGKPGATHGVGGALAVGVFLAARRSFRCSSVGSYAVGVSRRRTSSVIILAIYDVISWRSGISVSTGTSVCSSSVLPQQFLLFTNLLRKQIHSPL